MAIVSCPECSKKLKVADTSVGKKVKCTCGNIFVAQEEAAQARPAPALGDKVMVACTECSAKLKVATTSIGKKMKCPKCGGVFVAALEAPPPVAKAPALFVDEPDDVEEVRPKAKAKHAKNDDDDFMAFAQQDAAGENEDETSFVDEDDMPKSKTKAKSKRRNDEEAEEDDAPRSKGKSARPPQRDDADAKPVYPSRLLPNILVALLLLSYTAGLVLVFLDIIPTGMPKFNPPPKRQVAQAFDENKLNKEEAAKLDGAWIVESAQMPGINLDALKGRKYVFADGKVTTPDPIEGPFTVDASKNPMWIDLPTPAKVNVQGIFAIDGDRLQLCTALPKKVNVNGKDIFQPGERPTQFDPKQGVLFVLVREKKGDAKKPDGKNGKDGDKTKDKEKSKTTASKLDGVWIGEFAEDRGVKQKEASGNRFTFADGKVRFPETPIDFAYRMDESKNPKWLDLIVPKLATIPGIFRIDGDKLHWAFASPGKDGKIGLRPSAFDSKNGMFMVLRRATKSDLNAPQFSHRQSQDNLKQIGLALHTYHDTNKTFPPAAIFDPAGKPLLSWRVAILPYIDQGPLYKEFDLTKPWNDPHNLKLIAKMPAIYVVPGTDGKNGKTHYLAVAGKHTVLEPQKGPGGMIGRKLTGLADGSSNCIVVVEAKNPVEWTKPDDLPYDDKTPLPKFGVASDGFNVLFADAHVELVPYTVPDNVLRPYLTCENGMPRQPLEGKGVSKKNDLEKNKKPAADKPEKTDKGKNSAKEDLAAAQAKILTLGAQAFAVQNNGNYPKTLGELLKKDATGFGPYIQDEKFLRDPWGRGYQYDAAGKRNGGLRPDIWTVTPDNRVIGNWAKK